MRTRTSSGTEESEWSEPLTDPNGAISTSPPGRFTQMSVSSPSDKENEPFPVYWERLCSEGNVVTGVVNDPSSTLTPVKLANIPAHGVYRRIVIEVPATLLWDEDSVIRVGNVVIRTHSGTIVGEKQASLETVAFDAMGNHVLETGFMGTEERTGRFIEVIADGLDHENAALRSSAAIGLLGLVVGNSVTAEMVFSEPYQADPGEPQSGFFEIPNYAMQPGTVDEVGLTIVDHALEHFLSDSDVDRSLQVALHWFDRGLRARTLLDGLTCYFIGIESILNAFVTANGPIPELQNRRSHATELKALLRGKLDRDTRSFLLDSLQRVSTRDRFSFYRSRRKLPDWWETTFANLARARNSAFHGAPASISDNVMDDAKSLLTTMLKAELGITIKLPWEKGPKIISTRLHYDLKDYGHH